jgi:hypothetical protein
MLTVVGNMKTLFLLRCRYLTITCANYAEQPRKERTLAKAPFEQVPIEQCFPTLAGIKHASFLNVFLFFLFFLFFLIVPHSSLCGTTISKRSIAEKV